MAQAHPDGLADNESTTNTASGGMITSGKPHLNGSTESDPDAQAMVIVSLRTQIQDLFTQVTQLNTKLVKSYDRVSDLEDDLHMASSNLRSSSLKISQLELERTQHLAALNTGLLVEKAQVTAELTRLMEKATEEAAQRGQAESARAAIEKDLDDLSASLFDQANTMVAEARFERSLSEDKVRTAEQALKSAEEAVTMMQQQMQELQAEKEEAERKMRDVQTRMGKGKWVERQEPGQFARTTRLLSSHTPYQEFLLFVAHLRSVHSSSPQLPAMSTLLPLPFLVRLLTEDSEPTIRLDLAPSLNWLSRRSVLAAIHNGQLTIEPMASAVLLQESSNPTPSIPGLNSGNSNISCALCGTLVFPNLESHSALGRPPVHSTLAQINGNSWSTSIFKRPLNYNSPPPSPPPRSKSRPPVPTAGLPQQVHIFRVTGPVTNSLPSVTIPSLPITSSSFASTSTTSQPPSHPHTQHPSTTSNQSSNIYPLCTSGWCLARLRATCSLWAFVRSGIVEKVWEEEVPNLLPPPVATSATNGDKPPVPPRRRGLWGMASALGERAASWSESDKDKKKAQSQPMSKQQSTPVSTPITEKKLPMAPTPPPVHPQIAAAAVAAETTHNVPVKSPTPPPLPKRNEGRRPTRPDTSPTEVDTKPADNVAAEGSSSVTTESPTAVAVRPENLPQSPTRVPLPESRPGTPNVPSRTASPAPGATGAPPPLPRRAIARGSRPLSSVGAPSADSAASGPSENTKEPPPRPARGPRRLSGEPVAVPVDPPTESTSLPSENAGEGSAPAATTSPSDNVEGEKGEDLTPTTAEAGAFVPAEDAAPAAPSTESSAEQVQDPAAPSTEEDTSAVKSTEPASETVPEVATSKTVTESAEKLPESDTSEPPRTVSPTTAVATEGEEADGVPVTNVGESGADAKPAATTAVVSLNGGDKSKTAVNGDVANGNSEEKAVTNDQNEKDGLASGGDKEVYVGDTTWEERTWKEVVRLKEVMFWARVGALRPED